MLTSGNWPSGPDEVAIDAKTASKKHFEVGDTIGVIARGPVQRFRIVGHGEVRRRLLARRRDDRDLRPARPPSSSSTSRASSTRSTSPPSPGTSSAAAGQRRSSRCCRPSAQVRTGQDQAKQATKDTSGFLNIFEDFLLAFGGIALFVGSFVIANTLSITIAQRTRELATLRTLGRDAPPGARLGDARGVRDRRDRLDRRPVPRARARQGASTRCWSRSGSTCRRPAPCSRTRTIIVVARSSASSSR